MKGRYTLTVTYSEPNPLYVPPPDFSKRAYSFDDPRTPGEMNAEITTVLSVELKPEQWERLKSDTLKAWEPAQDGHK